MKIKIEDVKHGFIVSRDNEALYLGNYLIDELIKSLEEYNETISEPLNEGEMYTLMTEEIDMIQIIPTIYGIVIQDDKEGIFILRGEVLNFIKEVTR